MPSYSFNEPAPNTFTTIDSNNLIDISGELDAPNCKQIKALEKEVEELKNKIKALEDLFKKTSNWPEEKESPLENIL